jgi:hypothetical protein
MFGTFCLELIDLSGSAGFEVEVVVVDLEDAFHPYTSTALTYNQVF